MFQVHRSFIMN